MKCCAVFVINSTVNGNINRGQICLNLVGCFSFNKKPFHRRLTVAEHVLLRNYLNQNEFAEAVRVLLREGKYRRIFFNGGCWLWQNTL